MEIGLGFDFLLNLVNAFAVCLINGIFMNFNSFTKYHVQMDSKISRDLT